MKLWVATFFLKQGAECDPCEIPEQEQVIGIWISAMFMGQKYVKVVVCTEDAAGAWDIINGCFPDREVENEPGFYVLPSLPHAVFPPDRRWVAERMKKALQDIAATAGQADKALQD